MAHRMRQVFAATALALVLGACSPQTDDGSARVTEAGAAVECVSIETGALLRWDGTKFVAAEAPEPVIIERVIEPDLSWTDSLEAGFPDLGFPWLGLDDRNVGADVITLTGLAPTASAKARALEAGEAAIKATAQGASMLVIDGISVEGGEEAVGAALGSLDAGASVGECQEAFVRVMDGRNVSFAMGGASIDSESARLLDAASAVATLCQDYEIEIGGHTDSVGNALNNQRLSERRAAAVRAYLIERGVPGEALVALGYGESALLDTGNTAAAHARNRRTEFTVRER